MASSSPLGTLWQHYYAGKHNEVLQGVNSALVSGHASDFLHVGGLSLLAKGQVAEGAQLLKTSLLIDPTLPQRFANATNAAIAAGALQEALHFAQAGVARHPNAALLHKCLGDVLLHSDRPAEALVALRRAQELDPKLNNVAGNLGSALRFCGQPEAALLAYERAAVHQPDPNVFVNWISLLTELGRYDDAWAMLQVKRAPDCPGYTRLRAMLDLMEGRYKSGFAAYRSRFECEMPPIKFRRPLIDNLRQAAGRHVLVGHEGGFGDDLMFIRYLPRLADVAGRVTVKMPKDLHRIFAGIDSRVRIVANHAEAGNYDMECPVQEFPYLFGTELDTIPTAPYLAVSAAAIAQRRLPDLSPGATLRVGLCWAGQMRSDISSAAIDRRRSMTWDQIAPLLEVQGVDFFSLQLGSPANQMPSGKCRRVLDTSDFADTAAIVAQLDLVITVDTAVAHLAGAMGRPVWLLNRFDTCWRWLRDRDNSPWYPTMRIFRQRKPGDWAGVIGRCAAALEAARGK